MSKLRTELRKSKMIQMMRMTRKILMKMGKTRTRMKMKKIMTLMCWQLEMASVSFLLTAE